MTRLAEASTIIDLLEIGSSDRPAIVVPDGPVISYGSLRSQVHALAGQLNEWGIGKGHRVGIVLSNGADNIISFLAVAAAATAAPLNPAYTRDEFQFYLDDTNASAIITPPGGAQEAREAASEDTLLIAAMSNDEGKVSFTLENAPKPSCSKSDPGPDDVALVLHTSGTTSRPKRVPLAHGNLTTSVRNIVETYDLTPDDVSLCVMPLFHVHGLVASLLSTLGSGGTVVAPSRFDALRFWSIVNSNGVTWYTAVPSMHQALVGRARRRSASDDAFHETLRFIRSCSSPLAPTVMQEMEDLFSVPVLEAYGMTEAAHQMASNPLPPGDRKAGTVGVSTGVSVGIMDDDGHILDQGATGEIVIKGANVIGGYEGNPDANAISFTNGWFRTGDQGFLDEQGYLTLTGRLKELINRGGEKISPREIDEVLLSHPSVSEAVAFAIPSERYGEDVCAAVVLGDDATDAELKAHCREHLAAFKLPRTIHIISEIPKTASGKIQRRIVAQHFTGQ
jgi:acyl-CoA synthetase (AMP-forming)/AMP-acid ligase II